MTSGSLVRRLRQLGGDAHVEREQDGARLARLDAAVARGRRRRAGHLRRHRRAELRHVLGRNLLRRRQPPDGDFGRDGCAGAVPVVRHDRICGSDAADHGQLAIRKRGCVYN